MGALSKFAERHRGHGLSLSRALYVGAILAYIGGVAIPRLINYRRADKVRRQTAEPDQAKLTPPAKRSKKSMTGPSVNKAFFLQLRQLVKVGRLPSLINALVYHCTYMQIHTAGVDKDTHVL